MTRSLKTSAEQSAGAQKLHRGLGRRHIQLIAIGGAIGTGLFMGTGKTIAVSGTSIILTYLLIGFFAFMVMRAMGELLLTKLDYRTFADFVADYLGDKASYFLGWTYWMSWIVSCIA
ncbi:amino acid transporter, partial [Xenorhabdus bovienii]|nr:amino acid transporter [Xenorhabdus bovienii]